MSGICSAHKHYEPGCRACEALPKIAGNEPMSADEKKPREWSIKPETGHMYPMGPSQSTAGCQVIEKSAYEQVAKERDALHSKINNYVTHTDLRLEEERAKSAKLVEALKFYANRSNWERVEGHTKWASNLKEVDCAIFNTGGGRARNALADYNSTTTQEEDK